MDNNKFVSMFMNRNSYYLWIILGLNILIHILDWKFAIPGYFVLGLLLFYNIRSNYNRQKELTRYIENLTFNIDSATKETLLNFPMPLVVIELDGAIIWYNSSFRTIFEGEKLLERTITSLAEELNPEKLVSNAPSFSKDITINKRHYNVLGNMVKVDDKVDRDNYIIMLYFIDMTEHEQLKVQYLEEKTAAGVVIIDNYDDLMQGVSDANKPQMMAEIERRITGWMAFSDGIIKKIERDRFFFFFKQGKLKAMEDKRFEILDAVKEINQDNKFPVTLSIGLAINAPTILESFQDAEVAIDIALGRGGDQVVIKDGGSFRFYGGNTREHEKRTRVKSRVIAHALRELIDQSPQVMIMGHWNPDIDCFGAALGIYRIVRHRGIPANIVLSDSNAAIDAMVYKVNKDPEYAEAFISSSTATERINGKTLLVIVDTHRAIFTECPELFKLTDQVVVIDHHRKGADFISDAVLTYHEIYASSTSEMVTEILQYVDDNIKLKPLEAEALFAGIVMDTKNFTFKTGVRTFEAASYLRRQGVDTISVKHLFQNDLQTFTAISNVVKDAEIIYDNLAISICPPDIKDSQMIAAQAADQLINLKGLQASFVLCSVGGDIAISGRSFGDVNVQVIMEKLGGGGHLSMAGAQLSGVNAYEARDRLKNAIREYMENSTVSVAGGSGVGDS